jgi:SAM-dependent methyltransferase
MDIVISNLFEFVNKELVFKEIHRILSNNGIFILLTLNQNSIYGITDDIIKKIKNVKSDKKRSSRTELIRMSKDHGFELLEFKINDGLIWLPGFIDKLLGKRIYMLVEKFFKPFSRNPFSNVMLVVIRKR